MNDSAISVIRSVLKIGAGVLVTKGLTDGAGAETLVGAVVGIIGVVWGIFHRKQPTV